jgi:hypothetical protein
VGACDTEGGGGGGGRVEDNEGGGFIGAGLSSTFAFGLGRGGGIGSEWVSDETLVDLEEPGGNDDRRRPCVR